MNASWQVGQVADIEIEVEGTKSKAPIDPAASRVWVRLTRPDGSIVEPRMFFTPTNPGDPTDHAGVWSAEQEWDQKGDWRMHVLVAGEYKTKRPLGYVIRVGDD